MENSIENDYIKYIRRLQDIFGTTVGSACGYRLTYAIYLYVPDSEFQ